MDEGRKIARGRGDRTPARLLFIVIATVAVFLAALWGLVELVQALV